MTPDRIEAAARAYYAEDWDYASEPGKEKARGRIRRAIDAAYPELSAGTHWLAPNELTDEMWADGDRECNDDEPLSIVWTAMRQAYLKDT